jgi:L-alanine-DL-glutamate epimerase-like enolase superfamily enzyme
MKIVKTEAIPVTLPIVPFSDAYSSYDRMNYVIAKVHLDNGVVGIGEASPIDPSFYGETQQSIIAAIQKCIDPAIRGQDPQNINKIEFIIRRRIAENYSAKTAVDMALYDAVGKSINAPVYSLLGGRFRERAPAALELGIVKPQDMQQTVDNILELKPTVVKLHVGTTPEEDVIEIKAFHEAMGSRALIRADANGAYTTDEAIRVIRKVDDCELEYFEQPVARTNLDGLAEIRRAVQTPIAVDESVWTPEEAMAVCKKQAADVINIKLTRVGGINPGKKIADIAQSAFLKTHIGCEIEFGVATAAKVHMAVALENATCAAAGEFTEMVMLRDNIVKQPYRIENSSIAPNDKPGLGVELDEEKMRRYTTPST